MIYLLPLLLLLFSPLHADQLDSLIDQEKQNQKQWTDDVDELPPAYLWGNKAGVEIYAASAYDGKAGSLCQPIEFDELIEMSRGTITDRETILNLSLPRVREMLQQSCMIRPNDKLIAVGEGWQKTVVVSEFVVRRDRLVCPHDSPFSLWASIEPQLEQEPIFFSSEGSWPETDNGFQRLREVEPLDQDSPIRKTVESLVPDQAEFKLMLVGLHATNADLLYLLRRRTATLEDDGLPNEILLIKSGTQVEKLWVERVDIKKGSGHLRVEAMLDYNHDGLIDVIVSGDHNGCPYQIVFEGTSTGLNRADFPIKPCSCQ